ncbi:helix-turn-helix domain-containing protein [Mycolicibacterium frederiksbergense]|uniref:helix-turn-helix domain-containing protein n=1 Tax=Mycolicibacterium frederiksbergense TaxID=117567 RepID=UPI001F37AF98|nr:helix-turn-helix domain-containing protein [Mycolicibacterium frederiksbergense]
MRLTDASEYLRVASSTAHRLLSMLQYRGFVRQDPASKAYQPGPSLTNVAFAVHSRRTYHARPPRFCASWSTRFRNRARRNVGRQTGSLHRDTRKPFCRPGDLAFG